MLVLKRRRGTLTDMLTCQELHTGSEDEVRHAHKHTMEQDSPAARASDGKAGFSNDADSVPQW